jgi:signal transduction histidine kinase
MDPVQGIQERRRPLSGPQDRAKVVRGQGALLADGDYLFVALNVYELHEMQEVIERGFFWGGAATLLMAMAGGAAVSVRVLGRVEALSRASREIVAGNLQRRLPLAGSEDEFDHLATSLKTMLDRIQVLMDGMRQVSTDIAHDLRTPLSRLRHRIELALRKAADADALQTALESTIGDVDAVLETFSALLRIAQIEANARQAGFSRIDLSGILDTVVEVYLPFAEERCRSRATGSFCCSFLPTSWRMPSGTPRKGPKLALLPAWTAKASRSRSRMTDLEFLPRCANACSSASSASRPAGRPRATAWA